MSQIFLVFQHKKRNNDSPIEGGVEAFFVFSQKKTNTTAIPRVNEISFDIYKKYSKGKSKNDFLFPRTERGNPISDVHFNKHIKTISKVLGFNRKVVIRVIGSKGRELQREEKQLWEVVSSHCGRKTFIKTLVLNEDYTTREIMSQTGHSSEKVFHQYYKLRERDLLKKVNFYLVNESEREAIALRAYNHLNQNRFDKSFDLIEKVKKN
jgi:integrase